MVCLKVGISRLSHVFALVRINRRTLDYIDQKDYESEYQKEN